MTNPYVRYETNDASKLGPAVDAGWVYAVIDAAGKEILLRKLLELGPVRAKCLFRGPALEELWAVAPYLVSIDRPLFDWLQRTVWQDPWGILAITKTPEQSLFRHLRGLLLVEDPDGETLYFRYYDPRVLEPFLSMCSPEQSTELFGPLSAFGIPRKWPNKVLLVRP